LQKNNKIKRVLAVFLKIVNVPESYPMSIN